MSGRTGQQRRAHGGIAGRVDAMLGAVEAQKTTGGLHYHYVIFVQRIHHFATLKDIAEQIKEEFLNAEDA